MNSLVRFLLSQLLLVCSTGAIGINYGTHGDKLPPPSQVVSIIKSLSIGVDQVKIYSYSSDIIRAFSGSGLKLAIAIENGEVASFAGGSKASDWVKQTVVPHASTINLVIVGNELNPNNGDLVPAMQKIWNALRSNGLDRIKVTTPLALKDDMISNTYPPSNAVFKPAVTNLINFLASSGSPFMVNLYPYFSLSDPKVPLDYALFRSNKVVVQDGNYGYKNLLDALLDAVVVALGKAGKPNMQVVIGETGWPNSGAQYATVDNARQYNQGVVNKGGSPRRPSGVSTYIFALFNENMKGGDAVEKFWGILKPNGSPVYPLRK